MKNKHLVVEHYKRCTTGELLIIAARPEELEKEIIPELQAELERRNENEAAQNLAAFVAEPPLSYKDLSREELIQLIRERMETGEPIETIRQDLNEKGIDWFEFLDEDVQEKNSKLEYIAALKEEGADEATVDDRLQSAFGITPGEAEELRQQSRKKGALLLWVGYSLLIAMLLLMAWAVSNGGFLGLMGIVLLITGAVSIAKGHTLRR